MLDRLGPYLLGPNDTEENGIYTGDARELAKAIPDESVDLMLLDPPFGIKFDYENGYQDDPEQYPALVRWIVSECNRVIKPGGLSFVFVAQPQLRDIWPLFPEDSRIFAACKNFVQMRPCRVQFSYDPVIFWHKEGPRLKEDKGRDWFVANTANTNSRGANEAGFHSCPRPLDTITYMIDCFCPPSGIACDFFMGSGTTALGAKITGRRWLGFEIMPETARQARQRIASNSQIPMPLFVPQSGLTGGCACTPYPLSQATR
jgi:site-specific DNA-methyltransferase (adenine-specific)